MDAMKRIVSMALVFALLILVAPLQLLTVNAASTTATISFADVANRTEFDASKQVWQQNGITVTNEKTETSSDVADYSNPARFYKYSKLTIAYPGMEQIVVTCKYADNAQALQTVADAVEGATATVSDTVVTIALSAAADEFVIDSLSAGKVFVLELTVSTEASAPVEPEQPEEPETPEVTGGVTISFADAANRTEFDASKQVWQQNGITVTNEKTETSSDVADYSNPARFYKYSKLTIAYPGMEQIVVTCKYADNAQALQTVADAMDGVTATVSETVVTITLDAAADSLVIESLSEGKVFVNEITVYTDGSAPEVPETPEEPEEPEEPETTEIVDIATALAGAEGETFSVKGVVTVVDSSNYYVQDATGAICVRLATNTTEIALGDTIIGTGTRASYNGMPQLGSATFEKSSGLTLEAKETTIDALTTADICTYVTIKGLTVTEVYDKDGQYTSPNVTAQDANGKSIQIYKAVVAKNGDEWAIKVGDVIDVTAGVGCYNATLQLRNTLETEIVVTGENTEEPEEPEEPETLEIVDIATALAGESGTYKVKGVVTLVDGRNYYVQDATGAICVRMAEETDEIALGDTIIGTGNRADYNGLPQLDSATFEKSSGLELKAKETTVDALTTADICTYVTIQGLTVTEVYDNNGQYSTPNLTVTDEAGNTIQLYKAAVAKENDAWTVQVGDVIDVTGAVGINKGAFQLRTTLTSEIVLAGTTPEQPGESTYADFNGDGQITDADAIYLLRHTLFPENYEIKVDGDINGDGNVTDADAIYLLRYTLFPENYPLLKKEQ